MSFCSWGWLVPACATLASHCGTCLGWFQPVAGMQPLNFIERPGQQERSGRLLVRPIQEATWVARGTSPVDAIKLTADARHALNADAISTLPDTDIFVVALRAGQTEESRAAELMATGLYEYAEPDWIIYPARSGQPITPDDPAFRQQWHLNRINAPRAWNATTGDGSIVCAFVDTGIDLTHPDLAPLLVPGFNAVNRVAQGAGGLVSDVNGHGTSVAGAAAAMGNNHSGSLGVCWSSRIMPIRASNYASGAAFLSDVLYGASWAAYYGAKVVSVSYTGVESSSIEPTGLVIRQSYGGLLVWAAGNNAANFSWFDHPSVTIVGSTDINDHRAPDTNYGRAIDVMAPGVSILVPRLGGGYWYDSGTSFAAPIAAGVLALEWSAAPSMTPDQAMNALYQSCDPLEPVSEFNNTGWGRVNAGNAVQRSTGHVAPKEAVFYPAEQSLGSTASGLRVRYFAMPGITTLPPTFNGTPLATSVLPAINCQQTNQGNPQSFVGCPLSWGFAMTVDGVIDIPTTGTYTLTLTSRDGSRLFIDQMLVLNNDGVHAPSFRSGTVMLEAGAHEIQCDYFSSGNQPSIMLNIRGQNAGDQTVPATMFRRRIINNVAESP